MKAIPALLSPLGLRPRGWLLPRSLAERICPLFSLFAPRAAPRPYAPSDLEHVLVTSDAGFDNDFEQLAAELKTTAVFDGVGGDLITRIAPRLPRKSTVWFYGFLAGAVPVAMPSAVFMAKNLTMKPFSNFNSTTVRDAAKLQQALAYLEKHIADPLFRTKVGRTFSLDQIQVSTAYETEPGAKAVLLPQPRMEMTGHGA